MFQPVKKRYNWEKPFSKLKKSDAAIVMEITTRTEYFNNIKTSYVTTLWEHYLKECFKSPDNRTLLWNHTPNCDIHHYNISPILNAFNQLLCSCKMLKPNHILGGANKSPAVLFVHKWQSPSYKNKNICNRNIIYMTLWSLNIWKYCTGY